MGLLDDAIREHLDLKRARGADPAEVERLEREALGPVRRGLAVVTPRLDDPRAIASAPFDQDFHGERLTDLEELQELGYNDSTAPHPHHWHQVHEPGAMGDDHVTERHELRRTRGEDQDPHGVTDQPRRRFLRRNRSSSVPESEAPDETEPTGLYEPSEDLGQFDDYRSAGFDAQDVDPHPVDSTPPQLQFERPPRRPNFTVDPYSSVSNPSGPDPDQPAEITESQPSGADPPATTSWGQLDEASETVQTGSPAASEPSDHHTQETTEFDVQGHLAEPSSPAQEDVLEETPDFLQDTPEHDRLWFEQRPPKDFDFNG